MEISKRLQTIANSVEIGTNMVVDIGTDHGYIPIYLIKNKIANKCIACDIRPMPLSNASKNISYYSMENQIETRLSNGLEKIKPGEPDAIIIAGMGGMLIIDILKDSLEVVKAAGLLVLQPQLDIMSVRRYIHTIDFTITNEQMIYDDGKYYTVITAKPGVEKPYSKRGYMFGQKLLEEKNLVFQDFTKSKVKELTILENNILRVDTPNSKKRLKEVREELGIYKEVLE